jgi:hypothetical protein
MEKSETSKSLEAIIEKRRNCIPLTNEEEKLVNESLNKLLDAKKCVSKTVTSTTGDAIRKSAASPELPKAPSTDKATEGVPAQNRGKEGGYDSKADVSERKEGATDNAAVVPPVKDAAITDKKEEAVPSEKTEGKPYGDKTKEEWADADEKKHTQENYEEDRVGRMTEHANYDDSIKTQDIVVKTLSNGSKVVGHVLKVYQTKSGQVGLMVKWSDGRFEHVNQSNVELLKAVKSFQKDEKTEKGIGAFVSDVAANMLGTQLSDLLPKPKKPKIPKVPSSGPAEAGNIVTNKSADAPVIPAEVKAPEAAATEVSAAHAGEPLPAEAPEEFIRGVVDTLKEITDLSEEEIVAMAKSAWQELSVKEPVKKDAFDDAVAVASPIGQAAVARQGANKCEATKDDIKKEPEEKK